MRRRLAPALVAAALLGAGGGAVPTLAGPPSAEDLTALVNPLAGSLGPGFVTVGAGVPFGMVTPGAATTTPEADDPVNYVRHGCQDAPSRGYTMTRDSGAGSHIGGELPVMPPAGAVTSNDQPSFSSPFSHADEVVQPGYDAKTLTRYSTRAEL